MEFYEFIKKVEERLGTICRGGFRPYIQEVLAENGIRKTGVCIIEDRKTGISPLVYLDGYFRELEDGKEMEEILGEIQENLKWGGQAAGDYLETIRKLKRWEDVKDQVYPFLLSAKLNPDMHEIYAGRRMLDLEIFYMIRGKATGAGYERVRIKKTMLEQWDITEPEVFRQAVANLQNDGYSVRSMGTVLKSLVPEFPDKVLEAEECGAVDMYVFTNAKMSYGAAGILLGNDFFRKAMGGRNFYVLPSSMHELIFVPGERSEDGERFSEMVREVNEQMLGEDEILSDHAYYYDVGLGVLSAVEERENWK